MAPPCIAALPFTRRSYKHLTMRISTQVQWKEKRHPGRDCSSLGTGKQGGMIPPAPGSVEILSATGGLVLAPPDKELGMIETALGFFITPDLLEADPAVIPGIHMVGV